MAIGGRFAVCHYSVPGCADRGAGVRRYVLDQRQPSLWRILGRSERFIRRNWYIMAWFAIYTLIAWYIVYYQLENIVGGIK